MKILILLCLIFLQPLFASWSSDVKSMEDKEEYLIIKKEDLKNLLFLSCEIAILNNKFLSKDLIKISDDLDKIYWKVREYNNYNQNLEEELPVLKNRIDLLEEQMKGFLKIKLDKLSDELFEETR